VAKHISLRKYFLSETKSREVKKTFLKSLAVVFTLALGSWHTLSAQNTVDAGPDDTICPPGCATLTATVNNTVGLNGTALTLSDDQWSPVVPLGFTFTFFGNNYTNIVVGSNNILTFDVSQANGYCQWPINNAIPSSSDPLNSIMCPWEDLYPPAGGTEVYTTTGTAPNRIFIVSYCSTPMYSCNNLLFTGSVMLYETTNVIEMHTANKYICAWNGSYGIQGIQDGTLPTPNAYFVPGRNYPSVYTLTNDGYRFTPTGPTTYTMSAIPFAPIILNSPAGAVMWSDLSTGWNVGSGSSITVCPSTTTSYVAALGSCAGAAYDTVTVVVNTLTVDAGPDDTICPGTPTQLNATSANTVTGWSWSPTTGLNNPNIQNPIASPTVTTTYTVTGSIGNCTSSDDITIVVSNTMSFSSSLTNATCPGACDGSASVNVTSTNGPFTYLWSPAGGNSDTATGLCAGTYTCTINAASGCNGTQTFTITQPNQIAVTTTPVPADCNASNGTATATSTGGTGPYTYSWNTVPIQTTQTATNLAMGIYTVTVTDANGCTQTQTVSIAQATPPVAVATAVPPGFVLGGNSQITVTGGNSYQWTPSTDLSCANCANPVATPQQTTTYCVLVTDTTTGCVDSTCLTIDVEIPCTSGGLDKLMPNAFSPNFDGKNDRYCIPPNACILNFHLRIYDRWGEMVFESTSMTDCWDGTYKGEDLNTGVYAFYFDAELTSGQKYHQQGNISLIK
jgi:gliding motility-associated-like protein